MTARHSLNNTPKPVLHNVYLDEGVVGAVPALALDGDLGVAVVVAVVMADPDQLAVVGGGRGVAHLRGQEVGEALGGEPVYVVDGVTLPGQRVDKHPSARSDSGLCNLKTSDYTKSKPISETVTVHSLSPSK